MGTTKKTLEVEEKHKDPKAKKMNFEQFRVWNCFLGFFARPWKEFRPLGALLWKLGSPATRRDVSATVLSTVMAIDFRCGSGVARASGSQRRTRLS